MRAGKLDRTIALCERTTAVNAAGAITETLVVVADVRAQVVAGSLTEAFAAFGSETTTPTTFRIRWRPDVTLDHVVTYQGRTFNVVEIVELGRRRGLDLKCREVS